MCDKDAMIMALAERVYAAHEVLARLAEKPRMKSMHTIEALTRKLQTSGGKVTYTAMKPNHKGQSKYRNKPTDYNGVRYQSKGEAAYAERLDAMKLSGEVREWIAQPKFRLGVPENVYVADFLVIYADGIIEVVDVKGMETAKFRRDLKLWERYGKLPLVVVKNGKESYRVS